MSSVAKVIEIIAEGESIEEAIENAVSEASQTVDNIKSVWASDIEAKVDSDNAVQYYRVKTKITFAINK